MGEISILYNVVREKTDQLTRRQRTEFDGSIMTHYENLEGSLLKTCGEGIDAVMECLQDERKTLTEICVFMNELLLFIQKSADAFEDADVSYEEVYKNFL